VMIFSSLLTGVICDLLHSKKLVLTIPFIFALLILTFIFRVEGWGLIFFVVLLGLIAAVVPAAAYAGMSDIVKKPQWISMGLGLLGVAQNFASVLGPILFGKIVEVTGWVNAALWSIPFCILGFLSIRLMKIK